MSLLKTMATATRVLTQLRHDPRTLAVMLVVPCVLLTLLKYVFEAEPHVFNVVAPMMLGIFPLLMMFLITSITTLRERRTGTLDRLLTMPISKLDFMAGYAIAFSLLGLLQACLLSAVTLGLLGVTVQGGAVPVLIAAVAAAFLGTSLGLLVSAFAKTEFQAIELVMPILMPQILLCGLFVARDHMAKLLQWIAKILPLTYSVDAMQQVTISPTWNAAFSRDLIVVVAFAITVLVLGAVTIRRKE